MAEPGSLRLSVRDPEGKEHEVTFSKDIARVGRARDCDLPLESGYVSRYHARFERTDDGWTVTDEGSKNGIFVNGQKVNGTWALDSDDTVRIGDFTLIVIPEEPEYEKTMAMPFLNRQTRAKLEAEQPAASPASEASTAASLPDATPPQPLQARQAPSEPVAMGEDTSLQSVSSASQPAASRLELEPDQRRAVIDGRDVGAAIGERGIWLLSMLRDAPDGREPGDLIEAVWGAGGADGEMLQRLVYRVQRQLEPESAAPALLTERPDGRYQLALA